MAPHDSDLLEGLHEWQPVHEIVRLTFKALHDVVKAQGEAVKNIERSLGQKVSKTENAALLAEKVNLTELSNTFDELSRIIDAKADAQDVGASLDRKANRADVQAALKVKADVSEVQRCLDEKANVDEVRTLFAWTAHRALAAPISPRLRSLLRRPVLWIAAVSPSSLCPHGFAGLSQSVRPLHTRVRSTLASAAHALPLQTRFPRCSGAKALQRPGRAQSQVGGEARGAHRGEALR